MESWCRCSWWERRWQALPGLLRESGKGLLYTYLLPYPPWSPRKTLTSLYEWVTVVEDALVHDANVTSCVVSGWRSPRHWVWTGAYHKTPLSLLSPSYGTCHHHKEHISLFFTFILTASTLLWTISSWSLPGAHLQLCFMVQKTILPWPVFIVGYLLLTFSTPFWGHNVTLEEKNKFTF